MSVDVSAVGLALGLDVISPPANGGITEAAFSGVATKGEIRTEPEESSESSSIGVPDDSDDEEGDVESKPNGSLPSLASLEESLPIKSVSLDSLSRIFDLVCNFEYTCACGCGCVKLMDGWLF